MMSVELSPLKNIWVTRKWATSRRRGILQGMEDTPSGKVIRAEVRFI